ncbi:hypothetical protein LXT21_24695 [Myxococcus sp. K38C18041901]|uniref:hypothetical protein n=1 Tax=Myxococcus guangdongensis TaxID=2906760 RepID=UPI0020A7BCB4|nr:hypothetical protein [Myxococcus guangdongensis]MCP3061987.1 hypothetical protein [Myxococcus guangdongensis]
MAEARAVPVWQIRLRAGNPRRLRDGATLFIWCAVGFIIFMPGLEFLIEVLQVLFDPTPMGERVDMRNIQAAGLVSGALALISFLSGWAVVGFLFARYLFPSLWAEDQVFVDATGVTWRRWFGPGSELKYQPFSEVAAVPRPLGGVELLLSSGRTVRIASLGTSAEHSELCNLLSSRADVGSRPREPVKCVPADKEAVDLPGGGTMLRSPRGDLEGRAWVRGGVALLLAGSAAMAAWRQGLDGFTVVDTLLATLLLGLAVWVGVSALPRFQSRCEWEVRPSTLDQVWYGMGPRLRERHRVRGLELRQKEYTDSEDGSWTETSLWMLTSRGAMLLEGGKVGGVSRAHLGEWLAWRLDVPFEHQRPD